MALDAAMLALCAAELGAALLDVRIDKIHQPTRDEVVMALRARSGSFKLLLSARTGFARVCLTDESYENPASPPSFCMLLRKHLLGGRLTGVHSVQSERIVFFAFECTNEMGDVVHNTLAAELMGRYCNLVLLRDAQAEGKAPRIIDALKRVDFEDSAVRQLLPGLAYTLPPKPARLDLMAAPPEEIVAAVRAAPRGMFDALQKTVGGVGPVVLREVCHRAFGPQDPSPGELDEAGWQRLCSAIESVREDHAAGGRFCIAWREDGSPAEFSFTPLTQYAPACKLECFDTCSAMLEAYYARRDRAERMRQRARQLHKTVQNLYERAVRRQAARQEDLARSLDSGALRTAGEVLTANLHAFKKGDAEVRLFNWATGAEETFKLDARLAPSQNAQKYFKEYKKRQTAAKMLAQLLRAGEREIAYLQTVLFEVEAAEGDAALDEVRAELKGQGYLKYYKPRDKRPKLADFWRYTSSDGFLILAGRNNAQNEKLTLKTARGKDLWFHVKNAPGSHVVVMSEGRDIPLATQNEAAQLAVLHSGQRGGAKVPVDFTEVKNIRKTGDLPLGMVLYEHYETAYVTPDDAVLAGLLARKEAAR